MDCTKSRWSRRNPGDKMWRRTISWFLLRALFPTQWDERSSAHNMLRRRSCGTNMLVSRSVRRLGNRRGKTYWGKRCCAQEVGTMMFGEFIRPPSLLATLFPIFNFNVLNFFSRRRSCLVVGSSLALGNVTGQVVTNNFPEERRPSTQGIQRRELLAPVSIQRTREDLFAQYRARQFWT